MKWALEPVRIEGRRVSVGNYRREDFDRIAEAIHDPEGWFGAHRKIDTYQKIAAMLEDNLQAQSAGLANPFVYTVGNEVAGISRFLRIEPGTKTLEIGGTWVAPKWRKTFVNTEVKFLLLRHCFETLGAERVEFRVSDRNPGSQRAMLRLGATLEGRLRNCLFYPGGASSDGFLFSVVKPEWEGIKARLLDMPAGRDPLPLKIETERLSLRRYELEDAPRVFELVDRNRADLAESFPGTVKGLANAGTAATYVLEKLHLWNTRAAYCYGAFLKHDGKLVGQVMVKNVNWEIPSAELGYFVDSGNRRTGLGREMAGGVLDQGLFAAGFRRVYSRILPSNESSTRLIQSLGFEREGLHRNEFLDGHGKLADVIYFSRISSESSELSRI